MIVYATLQRIILPKSRSTLQTGRIRETAKVALRSQSCFPALPVSSYGQLVYVTEHCGIYKIYQKFHSTAVGSIFGTACCARLSCPTGARRSPLENPLGQGAALLTKDTFFAPAQNVSFYPGFPSGCFAAQREWGTALPQQTNRMPLTSPAVCSLRFLPAVLWPEETVVRSVPLRSVCSYPILGALPPQ